MGRGEIKYMELQAVQYMNNFGALKYKDHSI